MLDSLASAIIKESNKEILKQTQIIEIAADCHSLFDLINGNAPFQKPLVIVQYPKSMGVLGSDIVIAARNALREFEVISYETA